MGQTQLPGLGPLVFFLSVLPYPHPSSPIDGHRPSGRAPDANGRRGATREGISHGSEAM